MTAGDGLPDELTQSGADEYVVRHHALVVKGRRGLAHLLDNWNELTTMTKLILLEEADTTELAENQDAITRVLLSGKESETVLSSAARRLCATSNAEFVLLLSHLQDKVDEPTEDRIARFLEALAEPNPADDNATGIESTPSSDSLIRASLEDGGWRKLALGFVIVVAALAAVGLVIALELFFLGPALGPVAVAATLVVWLVGIVYVGSILGLLSGPLADRILSLADTVSRWRP